MATEETISIEQALSVDEASQRYLRGELPVEEYERILTEYLPSTESLLRALDDNRGFVSSLARWRKHYERTA